MIKETITHLEIDPVKAKRRKQISGDNLEVFNNSETSSISKSDVQDTLQEVDSTLQSPIHEHLKMDTASTNDPTKESAARKKNRGRRKRMSRRLNDKDGLPSTDQTDIMSTLILSDEHHMLGNDDKLNKIQSVVPEFGFSMRQEFKSYNSKGITMSFLEGKDNVEPVSVSSSDLASICDPSLKQMAETNEKFEELEQTVEGSFVYGEKTPEASVVESKSRGRHPSSDVDVTKHVSLAIVNKKDNLLEVSHPLPERAPVSYSRRKLLILDINGLLANIVSPPPKECKADVNISGRAIFKRPFCHDFLKFCLEQFHVGIWSSRTKKIIDRVVDYLLGDMKHKLLFCWDLSHCTETGFKTLENRHKALVFKELRKVWEKHDPNLPWNKGDYNESNTLLLDDSPYKALLNPVHTAIFPYSYNFKDRSDNSLGPGGDLRVYLEDLAATENIQKYVGHHPFGQNVINETSPSWGFYLRVISSQCSVPTRR